MKAESLREKQSLNCQKKTDDGRYQCPSKKCNNSPSPHLTERIIANVESGILNVPQDVVCRYTATILHRAKTLKSYSLSRRQSYQGSECR